MEMTLKELQEQMDSDDIIIEKPKGNRLKSDWTQHKNTNGDILKEAIKDARDTRETALENAKMALEEAFTPQIKSMVNKTTTPISYKKKFLYLYHFL